MRRQLYKRVIVRANSTASMRAFPILAMSLLLIAGVIVTVRQSPTTHAAAAPSQQFPTVMGTPSGPPEAPGTNRTITYGTTGVTLNETNNAVSGNCTMGSAVTGAAVNAQTNVLAFIEPEFPAAAALTMAGCYSPAGSTRSYSLGFNKPLVAPILHLVNLDASYLDLAGTSTTGAPITYSTLIKNNRMLLAGNRFNTPPTPPIQAGCEANNGTNGDGACGSFRLGAASGLIQNIDFTNTSAAGNDTWFWTVSFPTVSLSKSFSPATITAGDTSQLTFSVTNPNETESITLTPLDFTDNFPAGIALASGATTNNGSCGSPVLTDGASGALNAGDASVKAADISVDAGATCTITVSVTANTQGSYLNATSNLSSTIGNVIPDTSATLTVTPRKAWSTQKTVSPSDDTKPGDTRTYTITIKNTGTILLTGADTPTLTDNLSDILDDATYNNDAVATAGQVNYTNPNLTWSGDLGVGQTVTLTYSATIKSEGALGDSRLINAVTGATNCPDPAITNPNDPGFNADCVVITTLSATDTTLASTGWSLWTYGAIGGVCVLFGVVGVIRRLRPIN